MSTLKTKFLSAPINGAVVEKLILQTNNIDRVTIDESGNVTVSNNLTVNGTLVGGVPAGTVIHVAMNSAPAGYLKANGAAVSRTVYAALFAAIGTSYGVGDGSSTFNLPDLRGEFIRSWDDGRGVDASRTIGSAQAQEISEHRHELPFNWNTSNGDIWLPGTRPFGTGGTFSMTRLNGSTTASASTQSYALSGDPLASSITGENRPRNVALLACIKF